MRPLDDVFSSSSPSSTRPKSRPSSITSRSPSSGLRQSSGGGGHGYGTASGAGGAGGLTFFLTEENNFGVHSMSESHISSRSISRSPPQPTPAVTSTTDAEIIEKPDDEEQENSGSFEADSAIYTEASKKTEPESNAGPPVSAIPSNVLQRGHFSAPSIGSNISPTISASSSPKHNLSSSAISDDSELDISSHHEEENTPSDSISSSFPQLVMPRVNVPRRKAFTETGRTLGKLKIMVVGDSGISSCNYSDFRDWKVQSYSSYFTNYT